MDEELKILLKSIDNKLSILQERIVYATEFLEYIQEELCRIADEGGN